MNRIPKVAFVSGGHPYEVVNLHAALRALPGLDIYPQHMDDWTAAGPARQTYDVVVFYHMLMDGPPDKGAWYQGAVRAALEELGTTGQGIVVLHHATLGYPQWKLWSDLVGIENRKFGYHQNQQFRVHVADAGHPITRGLQDWDMPDETYTMDEPLAANGNTPLLTVEHPKSMKCIAWTRQFKQARVFCFASGHDGQTFSHPMFREVLGRGIRWVAPVAKPAELPATMPGIMFVAKGQAALQQEPAPVCAPGQVLCETLYSGLTNGTERNVLTGGNYGGSWPSRCGYQNVGRVIEVGAGVTEYAAGDVIFTGDFRQHVRWFAQEAVNPARLVVKLPAAVKPQHAALFGMASVALHDVRRAGTKIGDRVLVVGAGAIGQFTAQAARAAGAVVTIVDLDERRLAVARQCGIPAAVQITGDGTWAELKRQGAFDIVFEDSGAPVLDALVGANWGRGLIKTRGRIVVIAGRSRVDYSFNAAQGSELEVNHAGHFDRGDLEQLCRFVAEGTIQIAPIIQDLVPIQDAVGIYDRLRDQPNTLFGTVFDWTKE
jgi:2-desacetyl-2-hydroxyethyl bacteriochlorophyllide A dehydrogenase